MLGRFVTSGNIIFNDIICSNALLLAENIDLQALFNTINVCSNKYNMEINAKKIKYMVVEKGSKRTTKINSAC